MPPHRMHADEVDVDDQVVRALLADQVPQLADLPLRRISTTGTDNVIYRLGEGFGVRVPRIGWAVPQIAKEHQLLPRLAPLLPAAVPVPVAVGTPARGYPYAWLVYRWVDGDDALVARVGDWCALAREVAVFVKALQALDTTGGPPAPNRGGALLPRDESTRRAIRTLGDVVDVERALSVWDAALAAEPWGPRSVWVHGDLLPGNLVVRGGRLSGVIDWSAAGVGDPAADVMLAWSLPPDARSVYLAALDVDEATWARARGWTVEQAAHFIPYYAATIPAAVAAARGRLVAAVADGR